jgi:hypothetical protein
MPCARSVVRAFSPLDEELQLVPGHLTPSLQEQLVRLSTWMPFARAAREFQWFTHVPVSEFLTRQLSEAAGAAYVEVQTAQVKGLEGTTPPAPAGPPLQLLSADGAMVPLVHGEWTEVKTVVVGTVQPPVLEKGAAVVHTTELSYFSRLAPAEEFGRLSLVEMHRRGVERAGQVCAVTDGAVWEQGFIDLHRHDAVRILDFPHAAEHVTQAGQVVHGEETPALKAWLADSLHELKHGSPDGVLERLRALHQEAVAQGVPQASVIQDSVEYLKKRRAQIAYAEFQAQGYPIGSGSVESGNKLVVEVRLKGSGMHWARTHVNPMLALRNIACNDRWAEAWPQIEQHRRQQERVARAQRWQQRRGPRPSVASMPPSSRPEDAPPRRRAAPVPRPTSQRKPRTATGKPHPPAANHPWRHMPIGRALFFPRQKRSDAKV